MCELAYLCTRPFQCGQAQRIALLRLRKELFAFQDNKIAVQFFYEWNDQPEGKGQWYRTYGLEVRRMNPYHIVGNTSND